MVKRYIICLIVILSILLSTISAQAVSAQLMQSGYEYDVDVSDAQMGCDYVLICVKGDLQSFSVNTILEDGALLYIHQVQAQADSFSFGGFLPSVIEEATVFIVDGSGNKLRVGVLRQPEKGDLDGNGLITTADRELMLQYLAACVDISESAQYAADIDYSGYVDVIDLSILNDMIEYGW